MVDKALGKLIEVAAGAGMDRTAWRTWPAWPGRGIPK